MCAICMLAVIWHNMMVCYSVNVMVVVAMITIKDSEKVK